jgi:hypothetical protein
MTLTLLRLATIWDQILVRRVTLPLQLSPTTRMWVIACKRLEVHSSTIRWMVFLYPVALPAHARGRLLRMRPSEIYTNTHKCTAPGPTMLTPTEANLPLKSGQLFSRRKQDNFTQERQNLVLFAGMSSYLQHTTRASGMSILLHLSRTTLSACRSLSHL